MALKLGWFGVRDKQPGDVITALRAIARRDRKIAIPEDGFRIVGARGNTAAMLLGWEFASVHDWARAASQVLATATVSFLLLEGCWDYAVHQAGATLGGMGWYPEAEPWIDGDLARAAAALAVPEALLQRYHDAILEMLAANEVEVEDDDEYHGVRAFDDDDHGAADEWAHAALAGRLGFDYPEPSAGQIARVTR